MFKFKKTCTNCGGTGHYMRQCYHPTLSFGIVAIREINQGIQGAVVKPCDLDIYDTHVRPELSHTLPGIKDDCDYNVCLIQRRDTLAFIDYIKGKHNNNDELIRTFIGEMTTDERIKLQTLSFQELWNSTWLNHHSQVYRKDFLTAYNKFQKVKLNKYIPHKEVVGRYKSTEFCFPKGRRHANESQLQTACREFEEETGFTRNEYRMIDVPPMEETFYGTNKVRYSHIYFLALIEKNATGPRVDITNISQIGEIKNVGMFSFKESWQLFRPYDIAKREILLHVHTHLKNKYWKSAIERPFDVHNAIMSWYDPYPNRMRLPASSRLDFFDSFQNVGHPILKLPGSSAL